ncbi:hypothetical protein N9023_01275 [Opitutaceae bacterium]|nr:hypothetical protein [Opitutaceae bacterium]
MKLARILSSLAGAGIVVALTMALTLPAQETAPEPIQPDPTPEAPASAPDVPEAPEAPPETADAEDEGLRELGVEAESEAVVEPTSAADVADQIIEAIQEELGETLTVTVETDGDGSTEPEKELRVVQPRSGRSGEVVRFGSSAHLPAGEVARSVVAIFGDVLVDGESRNEAVAILGNNTINGEVGNEAVAVLGNNTVNGKVGNEVVAVLGDVTINGEVGHEVVAVMGSVFLGPEAVVNGNVRSIGGRVERAPGSVLKGDTYQVDVPIIGAEIGDGVKAWVHHCLRYLRPLAFADNLGWLWTIMLTALGFYCLLALMLPDVVRRSAETMETYPGMSLLSAVLAVVITPIAMIVLSVTVVGPVVLGLLLFCIGIFGKVVFLAWLGRRVTEPAGWKMPALAVLIGGLITLAIYLVPVLGFIFQKLSGFLGTGIVIYTIILAMKQNAAEKPVPPAPAPVSGTVPPPAPASPASGAATGAEMNVGAMGGGSHFGFSIDSDVGGGWTRANNVGRRRPSNSAPHARRFAGRSVVDVATGRILDPIRRDLD